MDRVSSALDTALEAMQSDLLADGGPQISTMRNYRFAIVVYHPTEEWALRAKLAEIVSRLRARDWATSTLSLARLLLDRARREFAEGELDARVAQEKRMFRRAPERGLAVAEDLLVPLIDEERGLASEIIAKVQSFATESEAKGERRVVFLSELGALYPFFHSSALLRRLDGKTSNIPIVLLYPGVKKHDGGLSFMSESSADRDYRPRIY